jgi:hypothetical protein
MSYLSRTVLKAEERGFVARAKSAKDKRKEFANWRTLSALLIPNNTLIPGLSLRSNPDGLKLANAFGVDGQTLWLRLCCAASCG